MCGYWTQGNAGCVPETRKSLNYANLNSQGNGKYRVKTARQPRCIGASIIPLNGTEAITTCVTVTGNAPFIGTLAISGSGGVRYLDVKNDTVEAYCWKWRRSYRGNCEHAKCLGVV